MEWKGLFLAVPSSLHPVVLRDIVFPFFFLPFIPQSLLTSGRGALEQRDWWERCEKLLGIVYRLAAFVHLAPQRFLVTRGLPNESFWAGLRRGICPRICFLKT